MRAGFEPARPLPAYPGFNRALSTTQSPLHTVSRQLGGLGLKRRCEVQRADQDPCPTQWARHRALVVSSVLPEPRSPVLPAPAARRAAPAFRPPSSLAELRPSGRGMVGRGCASPSCGCRFLGRALDLAPVPDRSSEAVALKGAGSLDGRLKRFECPARIEG